MFVDGAFNVSKNHGNRQLQNCRKIDFSITPAAQERDELLMLRKFSTRDEQVCHLAAVHAALRIVFSSRSIFSIDILNAESLLIRRAIRL